MVMDPRVTFFFSLWKDTHSYFLRVGPSGCSSTTVLTALLPLSLSASVDLHHWNAVLAC